MPAQQPEYRGMHMEVVVAIYVRGMDPRLFQPVELRFDFTVELSQKIGLAVFYPGPRRAIFEKAARIRETGNFGTGQNGPSVTEGHMEPDGEVFSLPGYFHGILEGGPSGHKARRSEYSPIMRLGNSKVH